MAGRQGVGEWNILGTLTFEGWLKLDIIVLTNATVTVCHHHGKGNDDDYHHHHHHGHNHNRNQKQAWICVRVIVLMMVLTRLCCWHPTLSASRRTAGSVVRKTATERLLGWSNDRCFNDFDSGHDIYINISKSNQIKCRAFLYMYQRNSNEAK